MKHKMILVFLLCLISISGYAQKEIKFSELESLFQEYNLGFKARQAQLDVFAGRKLDVAKKTDPVFSTSVESLSNGSRETESTFVLSQELDINNTRKWRVKSLEHERKALSHRLMFEFRSEVSEIKRIFCRELILEKDVAALKEVLETVQEIETKTKVRLTTGDVAEVDVMRLAAEKRKLALLIADIESKAMLERKNLALAIGLATHPVSLESSLPELPKTLDFDTLLKEALNNRSDFKAVREQILAGENLIVAAKKEPRSPLNIEGGYKARNGGFKGFVLGVSTPLPLSNKNKGKILELQAENKLQKLQADAAEKELAGELAIAEEKYSFLQKRELELSKQIEELAKIASIARFNFETGEDGLLEILDAVRSQNDLILELNQTRMEAYFVVFNIESLTGVNLMEEGDSK